MKTFNEAVTFKYKDYAIGGKLVMGHVEYENDQLIGLSDTDKDIIRKNLVEQLASEILSSNLCEITQMKTVHGTTKLAVRAYLAPNSTVQLLRRLEE